MLCVSSFQKIACLLLFWEINGGEMVLNDYGEIAEKLWLEIPSHFEDMKLDEYITMPNHVHVLLLLSIVMKNR